MLGARTQSAHGLTSSIPIYHRCLIGCCAWCARREKPTTGPFSTAQAMADCAPCACASSTHAKANATTFCSGLHAAHAKKAAPISHGTCCWRQRGEQDYQKRKQDEPSTADSINEQRESGQAARDPAQAVRHAWLKQRA